MWTSDRAFFVYFVIAILVLFMWLISWTVEKKEIQFKNRNCQPTSYFAETRGASFTIKAGLDKEIRDEYNHNVSQQVYMSVEAWEMVKTAKEDLIMDINSSMEGLNEESSSIDLAKSVFEHLMNKNIDPIDHALKTVKSEISRSF